MDFLLMKKYYFFLLQNLLPPVLLIQISTMVVDPYCIKYDQLNVPNPNIYVLLKIIKEIL